MLARTDHAASRRPDRIASRRRGNSAAPMASPSPASDFMRPPTQKHNGEAPGAATATPEWEWHPRPPGPHPIPYPPLQRTARRGRPGRWERAPCWLSLAVCGGDRSSNEGSGAALLAGARSPCSGAGAGSDRSAAAVSSDRPGALAFSGHEVTAPCCIVRRDVR